MLEAGAPLHYVMDQVGHEDSKTTLEIYAQVQKRLSRPQVKRAFEALLAETDLGSAGIPADAREEMSRQTSGSAKKHAGRRPKGPVVSKSGPQTYNQPLEDDLKLPRHTQKPRISRAFHDGHGWFRTSDLSRVKRALSH